VIQIQILTKFVTLQCDYNAYVFVAFSSLSALEQMVVICEQTADNIGILFNSVLNVLVIKCIVRACESDNEHHQDHLYK